MRQGPLYMLLGTAFFTLMVALVKVVREEMTAFEIMAWRSLTIMPLAWLAVGNKAFVMRDWRTMLVRAALGFGGMTCFFTASRYVSLAEISVLGKIQPIFVALLAPIVLGRAERSKPIVWGILLVGLIGCAFMIGPALAIGNAGGVWVLAAAALTAGAHVLVRSLKDEHPLAVVFWFHAFTLVGSLAVPALAAGGTVEGGLETPVLSFPSLSLLPYVLAVGLAAFCAQVLMTRAYQVERASVVAATSYLAPLWALLGDIIAFGTIPSFWSAFGGVLVIGAGIVLLLHKSGTSQGHSAPPELEAPHTRGRARIATPSLAFWRTESGSWRVSIVQAIRLWWAGRTGALRTSAAGTSRPK